MFSYKEILNLDVRDRAFWLRAARRQIILKQMRLVQAVRAGMSEEKGYSWTMDELREQLRELDGYDTVKQNWEDLKIIGRG